MNFVIILTAGKSKRMKGIDKVFCQIKRKPLVFYTILAFEKHPLVQKMVLVTRKNNFKKFYSLIKKYQFKKIVAITKGGKKRQDSSFQGLKIVEKLGAQAGDLILFHNGANPLVSKEEIDEVIRAAKKYKAALVGQPARDTIKEINKNGFLARTLDRKKIFLAQTPQVIEYQLAREAFKRARRENFYGTDDISLVERLGQKVKMVPASSRNIKVTYPEDLKFIQNFLK